MVNSDNNIFLVGPMGSGKTTIGRQLAKALNRRFYDSDREIEVRTGAAISLIFELEGESGFRKREVEMIDELTQCPKIVLATGGGAVIQEANRRHLRERGHVIYLKTGIEQLLARTSKDKSRPLLQTADPEQTIKKLLQEREPLYLEVAEIIVNTNDQPIREIVKQICMQVQQLK